MTFEKMGRIMGLIHAFEASGQIVASGSGELMLLPQGQFDLCLHHELMHRGFVYHEGEYYYRPRASLKG